MNRKYNNMRHEQRWRYCVFPERAYHIDLGQYHTYGIQLVSANSEKVLHDVSASEATAAWVTELLNCHQVFPCHFKNVVEDLIQQLNNMESPSGDLAYGLVRNLISK